MNIRTCFLAWFCWCRSDRRFREMLSLISRLSPRRIGFLDASSYRSMLILYRIYTLQGFIHSIELCWECSRQAFIRSHADRALSRAVGRWDCLLVFAFSYLFLPSADKFCWFTWEFFYRAILSIFMLVSFDLYYKYLLSTLY